MKFKDTYRLSPVIHEGDLPWEFDPYHLDSEEVPLKEKQREDFFMRNEMLEEDSEWWYEQFRRCRNGYTITKAIEPGGDFFVDEVDAFWNDSKKYVRTLKEWDNYQVPPNSVYIPEYDQLIRDGNLHIPGRFYFYLNFWKIYALSKDLDGNLIKDAKDYVEPRFTDLDLAFFWRTNLARKIGSDQSEAKARQKGYSEKMGGGILAWNWIFVPNSQNIVAGGMSDDADKTFRNFAKGIDMLGNTAFHKIRNKEEEGFYRSKYTGSEIHSITCKDNAQAISRYTPYCIIYEEVGKWKKGLIAEARQFVNASLKAEGFKSGWSIYIGCVCKGTMVYDRNGNMIEIENLKMNDGILGFDQQKGSISKELISYWQETYKKPCYRITTSSGRELECSEDHPLLVRKRYKNQFNHPRKNTEWSRTDQVENGWLLAVPEKINIWGKKKIFDPRLIGLLVGDGTYGLTNWKYKRKDGTVTVGKSGNVVLASADDEIWNYVEAKYKTSLSRKSQKTKDGRILHKKIIQSIYKELDILGIRGQTKKQKRIPKALYSADKKTVCEFIGGLYDSDGCIYVKENPDRYVVIKLSQANKELLVEVMYLLNKMGIHGKISYNKPDKKNTKSFNGHYDFCIKDQKSVINFCENIHLLIKSKQEKLSQAHQVVLKRAKTKSGIPDLKGLRFEKVVNVEYIGNQLIYNLTADTTHTYLANGIITHNTGGDMDLGAADLEDIHYNPLNYGVLSFRNKWEEEIIEGLKSGHFTPDWVFKIMDKYGNSLKKPSLELWAKEYEMEKKDKIAVFISQHARYAADAFLSKAGGYFDKKVVSHLNVIKSQIRKHREMQVVKRGNLKWIYGKKLKNGKKQILGVEFEPDEENGIHRIIEHPKIDGETKKPHEGLYIAGTDSYDQDEAKTSTSKLACRIFKKSLTGDPVANTFVAGLLVRPETIEGGAEKAFEESAKLCLYYGAINLIEWSKIRIFKWYEDHGFHFLLRERPDYVIANWIQNPMTSNRYGIDPSTMHNWLAELNDYLLTHWDKMRDVDQIVNFIRFKLDKNYNCDDTIASALCIVQWKDDDLKEINNRQNNQDDEDINDWEMGYKEVNGVLVQM